MAVLFMDLDGFIKVFKDSLRHEAGDLRLTVVAQRLGRCLRAEDTLARFGCDEFVVLLADVENYGDAVVVECDCGERPVLSLCETVCGADHAALVRVMLAFRQASDGISHPWDAECDGWRKKQDEYLVSEETYELELSRLD